MSNLTSTVRRILHTRLPRRLGTSLSDNERYPQACLLAANDLSVFANFRRLPDYNAILEHVTEEQGHEYLQLVRNDAEVLAALPALAANDEWGNPRTFAYPGIGHFSPSTLRYAKVLADLKRHFGSLSGMKICEIGVGYGGQCRAINALYQPASYVLVDIQPALALAQRYLDHYILPAVVDYKTMNELAASSYDLVISNYAFTELPRSIQDVYLHKIVRGAKRGYITYNQVTPPEFQSYPSSELIAMLPGCQRHEEVPLTYPGNCILVWNASR